MNTQKPIKLKSGETLPAGLPCSFLEPSTLCIVHAAGRDYKVRASSAFHAPSTEELEEAVNDCTCPSVFGETVEPDGWDCHGSPSWLLAFGLI